MRIDRGTDRHDEVNSAFLAILQTILKTQRFCDCIGPSPLAKSDSRTTTRVKNMDIQIQKRTMATSNPAENFIP